MFIQMYQEKFMRYPQGKTKALTLSYDDCVRANKRFVALLKEYGLKCTFNLESHIYDLAGEWNDHMSEEEAVSLFKDCGHEIAMHGATHVFPNKISLPEVIREYTLNREYLEHTYGCIVNGLAYAYGAYTDEVVEFLKLFGVKYARTVQSSFDFSVPEDWLRLKPTCHHNESQFPALAQKFFTADPTKENKNRESLLFYLWGHAYEFDRENGLDSWEAIEAFCKQAQERKDEIWFATNSEVYDYIRAYERLEYTCDGETVHNPSAIPVWVEVRGKTYRISPNETLTFTPADRKIK